MYKGIKERLTGANIVFWLPDVSTNLYADKMSMAALINASLASDKFDFNDLSTASETETKTNQSVFV